MEHADKERRTENASSVVDIRTSPVVDRKRDNRTLYAVDRSGGGRPFDRAFSFLDPLLARAALVDFVQAFVRGRNGKERSTQPRAQAPVSIGGLCEALANALIKTSRAMRIAARRKLLAGAVALAEIALHPDRAA